MAERQGVQRDDTTADRWRFFPLLLQDTSRTRTEREYQTVLFLGTLATT
jgi:hypothetical protein